MSDAEREREIRRDDEARLAGMGQKRQIQRNGLAVTTADIRAEVIRMTKPQGWLSEVRAAELAQVDRSVVREWLGKDGTKQDGEQK